MRALPCIAVGVLIAAIASAQAPAARHGLPPDEPVQAASEEAADKGLEHEVIEWEGDAEQAREKLHLPGIIPGRGWTVGWRRGLKLTSDDGNVAIQFGGRLLLDAGVFHFGHGLEDVVGRSRAGWDTESEVRQARIYGQGVFFERFFAKADLDVYAGEMRDVYWGIRNLGPLGTLQVGFMKEPFSLEEKNSNVALPFLERSVANLFSPQRGSGVLLTNTHFDRRLRWEVGTFFVVDAFEEANESQGFDGTYDLALRLTALPIWQEGEDDERMLLVGLSYARRVNITDPVSFATRPESTLAPIVADTGPIVGADTLDRGGVEAAWSNGRLTVQSELLYTHVNRPSLPGLEFWGGYAQASWLLTDDIRHYGRRSGAFGRIVPRKRFDPGAGHWGALEVAVRLSGLDLDDAAIHGGRLINGTVGVSWFPYTRVRLAANYVLSHRLGEGTANLFQTRLQIDY